MKNSILVIIIFFAINSFSQINGKAPVTFTSSNLPIVKINTAGVAIPNEPKIDATMQIIDNGTGMMNNVTDLPNIFDNKIGIELRGASSINYPQQPYKLETRNALNVKQNVSLLGMPLESDWILLSNYNDKVFIRNTLAYKLFNEMGNYATRTRFCEVVLNDEYVGVYLLMENIKRGANRVNIAKLDATEIAGIDVTGGYIIKNDYWDATNSWLSNFHPIDYPNLDVNLVYEYPKPAIIVAEQKTYIQNFINDFETALYGNDFADLVNGYNKYIDIDSFIDYLIVNELARNADGFKKSSYFHKDIDTATGLSKLKAGPIWDFDWAYKNIDECSIYAATDGSGWAYNVNNCGGDVNSTGWIVRLLQDQNFRNKFRCRWEDLRNTTISNASLMNYIDQTTTFLNDAQGRHYQKWEHLGQDTGTPEIENDPATFAGQVQKFKDWLTLRLSWLDANIPINTGTCGLSNVNNGAFGSRIFIFPNPSNTILNIDSNNIKISKIEIIDALGKVILSQNDTLNINVSGIANGIYICKIYGFDNNSKNIKIIIQH